MALAEPPFRERLLTAEGYVSPRWQSWLSELVRALRTLGL